MRSYFALTRYAGPAKRPGPATFANVIEPNDCGFVETPTTAMLRGANRRASSSGRYSGRGAFIRAPASHRLREAELGDDRRPAVVLGLDELRQLLGRAAAADDAQDLRLRGDLGAGEDLV